MTKGKADMENVEVVDADGHITDSEEGISAYLEEAGN